MKQVFNIAHILDSAGLNLTSVVKWFYMNDIGDSSIFNEIYAMNEAVSSRSSFAVVFTNGGKSKNGSHCHYES